MAGGAGDAQKRKEKKEQPLIRLSRHVETYLPSNEPGLFGSGQDLDFERFFFSIHSK
jgi:hypothetical protein